MGKLIDQVKFVVATQIYVPTTTTWNNQNYLLGNAINVESYRHVTIFILGGIAAVATGSVTVICAATDAACIVGGIAGGTSAYVNPGHYYLNSQTSAQSDTWTKTDVASTTSIIAALAATAHQNYIIEIETAKMTLGPWLAVNVVAGAGNDCYAAIYMLSQPRYISAEDAPTAIV